MNTVILVLVGLVGLFGMVLLFGAPYLPTLRRQTEDALDLLQLKKGDTLLELGSGDGRVLRAAAQRGIRGIGYELNPLLVVISWFVLFKYRRLASVKWRNYWRVTLPAADGVYIFLLERFMARMDEKLQNEVTKPLRVVSYAFEIPGRPKVAQKQALMVYEYGQPPQANFTPGSE